MHIDERLVSRKAKSKRPNWLLIFTIACTLSLPVFAQEGEPGVSGGVSSGSSAGSAGMPDVPEFYEKEVARAARKGKRSQAYIGSLIALGMHYNRAGRYEKASSTLNQALAIIDSGALKPMPAKARIPDRIVETRTGDTVSAQNIHQPLPYEETLQELWPQLATAEVGANQLAAAEIHIKRWIKFNTSSSVNPVADKLGMMSAYSQYAELLRRTHRSKEAKEYQRKADEINSSFVPL